MCSFRMLQRIDEDIKRKNVETHAENIHFQIACIFLSWCDKSSFVRSGRVTTANVSSFSFLCFLAIVLVLDDIRSG